MLVTPLHVVAGAAALCSGAVALYAAKGARLHRSSGMVFVYAMLVMSSTGAVLAALKPNWTDLLQGGLTFYLVTTAVLTVQRRPVAPWMNLLALLLVIAVGAAHLTFGVEAMQSATGKKFGYPPALYFVFGPLALLAAAGDLRMMLKGGLQGRERIARHLWRMCFAMFIATASFFLGRARIFPEAIRSMPVLGLLSVLPLLLMVYWLVRTLVRRAAAPAREVTVAADSH